MQLGVTVGRGHCSVFTQCGHAPNEPLAGEALHFSHPQAHSPVAQCRNYSADRSSISLRLAYIPAHMEVVDAALYCCHTDFVSQLGSTFTSSRLNPGMRPGRMILCCSE